MISHMTKVLAIVLATLATIFTSCSKEEGEGGTGCIQGKIYKVVHDDDNYMMAADTMLASKQDVFILYGDDGYIGDDVETGEDGCYRFKYLNPGTYTVYAYSETNSGEKIAVKKTVSLSKGKTVNVDDIYIHTGKAYGTSMIQGWVWADWFNKNGNTIASGWAYEQRVYIRRVDEPYHFDDVRVSDNGSYFFQKLLPDTYIIYTYSENTSTEVPYPVYDTVTIDKSGVIVQGDTLRVTLKA